MNHRCKNNRLQRAIGMVLIGGMIVLGSAVTALAQVAVDPASSLMRRSVVSLGTSTALVLIP